MTFGYAPFEGANPGDLQLFPVGAGGVVVEVEDDGIEVIVEESGDTIIVEVGE